jgi:hypothetical protein
MDSSKEEETKREEQIMPPVLYKLDNEINVYCLSQMYIPDKTGSSAKVRDKMLMFNKAIMNAEVAKLTPNIAREEIVEKRNFFLKNLHEAEKRHKQHLDSESFL